MNEAAMLQLLKQLFGYDSFREGQARLIKDILYRRDCLGVMPTGAGKSICYQIPALMLGGITIVVSPLISLMKDQVNALTQQGVRAAFINSSLTEKQVRLALQNAKNGVYKIIYIAPERLENADFLDFALNADIPMLAIDEAHCISQWGQDFRPSYVKIPEFLENLPNRPVVSAFTATATAEVRKDIVKLLGLHEPDVLVTGFNRKNLFFEVQKPNDKFSALLDFLAEKKSKTGIVYCSTRNTVEEVCERLNKNGYSTLRYHAGLSDAERRDNQDSFLRDEVKIMVATNAFGMGIDKSNVSFVVHYNMPKNIESYYQEAGRAGRDGENADCLLLFNGQDIRTNMYFIENNKDVTYPDMETEKMLKERDRQRLKKMTLYCQTNNCLRNYILNYFGEKTDSPCGNCGNCISAYEIVDTTIEAKMIISCILRVRERFGLKTIIDILRGSKNEKILRLGLDSLSTYNISTLSEKQLREITNHLIINEILYVTDDEFPVIKCGPMADEVLRDNIKVEIKVNKCSDEVTIKNIRGNRTVKTKNMKLSPKNNVLFEKLKALRLEIAAEQGVPAFVIFADSALTDMCVKQPQNNTEFLNVSGVGQFKLERYGEKFLEIIKTFLREN